MLAMQQPIHACVAKLISPRLWNKFLEHAPAVDKIVRGTKYPGQYQALADLK
jgi:hypothetical protein